MSNPRNAGRKPLPAGEKRQAVQIKLPPWLIKALDKHPGSRTGKIETAVIEKYQLEHPHE